MGRPFRFTNVVVEGGVIGNDTPYWITGPYLQRRGTAGFPYFHQGLDVGTPMHTPLVAPFDGEVGYVTRMGDGNSLTGIYGNSVWLNLDGGGAVMVAHLDSMLVDVGQRVEEGQQLGLSGNTGQSTGPHVHIQCSLADTTRLLLEVVDPLAFLTQVAARTRAVPQPPEPVLTPVEFAKQIRDLALQDIPARVLATKIDDLIALLA